MVAVFSQQTFTNTPAHGLSVSHALANSQEQGDRDKTTEIHGRLPVRPPLTRADDSLENCEARVGRVYPAARGSGGPVVEAVVLRGSGGGGGKWECQRPVERECQQKKRTKRMQYCNTTRNFFYSY